MKYYIVDDNKATVKSLVLISSADITGSLEPSFTR